MQAVAEFSLVSRSNKQTDENKQSNVANEIMVALIDPILLADSILLSTTKFPRASSDN